MIANGCIATIGERARASITDSGHVIWIPTENSSFDFGHEAAMLVPYNLPYNLVVLHLQFLIFYIFFFKRKYVKMGRRERFPRNIGGFMVWSDPRYEERDSVSGG